MAQDQSTEDGAGEVEAALPGAGRCAGHFDEQAMRNGTRIIQPRRYDAGSRFELSPHALFLET